MPAISILLKKTLTLNHIILSIDYTRNLNTLKKNLNFKLIAVFKNKLNSLEN